MCRALRTGLAACLTFALASSTLHLVALPAAAGPEPVVDGSTADNAQRKVAWAPDGALYFTFVQDVGGVPHVFVKVTRDEGQTWTALPRLSEGEAFRPGIATTYGGGVHVAWSEFVAGVRQVFYARWEGGPQWVERAQVSFTPGYSGFPALGADALSRIHLTWYGFDGETYRVYYRYREAGSGWSDPAVISGGVSDANSPSLAIGPDSSVHVAFFASVRGVAEVWYLHGGPEGWDDPERVSVAGQQSLRPSIAVPASGTPAVAFVQAGSGLAQVVISSRGEGGAWHTPAAISAPAEGGDNPSLALGADGEGSVFYEAPGGGLRMAALRGGVWATGAPLGLGASARWPSSSYATFPPAVAARPTFLVWTEGGPEYRLGWTMPPAFPPAGPQRSAVAPLPVAPALVALGLTALVMATAFAATRRPPARGRPPG